MCEQHRKGDVVGPEEALDSTVVETHRSGVAHGLAGCRLATEPVVVNTCSTSAFRSFLNHAAYSASNWVVRGPTR
ncbi:hypothetical protein AB0H60_19355 [Nocardia rhamnosiphila]|uniref:hypothetical protein n=1 Tax=Nocardia rhamnosiphila TaxID=426716 RepID=UPI0033EB7FB2